MKRLLTAMLLLAALCGRGWCASSNAGIGFQTTPRNDSKGIFYQWPVAAQEYSITYIATCTAPAVAAKNSVCQLVNPAGSNLTFIFTNARCWLGTAGLVQLTINNTPRTTLVGGGNNLFLGSPNTSQGKLYSDAITPLGTVLSMYNVGTVPASGMMAQQQYIDLAPGTGVEYEAQTVNVAINCEFYWFERTPG